MFLLFLLNIYSGTYLYMLYVLYMWRYKEEVDSQVPKGV